MQKKTHAEINEYWEEKGDPLLQPGLGCFHSRHKPHLEDLDRAGTWEVYPNDSYDPLAFELASLVESDLWHDV